MKILKSYKGLVVLICALFLRLIFTLFPSVFEVVYFERVFPAIRTIQAYIDFIWIIPGYGFLILLVLIIAIWKFIKRKNFKLYLRWLLNFISVGLTLFLLLFGYQYIDKGIAQRAELETAPDNFDLVLLYKEAMDSCLAARSRIENIDNFENIVEYPSLPDKSEIQNAIISTISPFGYSASKTPIALKAIKPDGLLRGLGISGIYNPFTGEANIESALPSIKRIFVIAHEMAHASGITSEAEANFVAYLSCLKSGKPIMEYAAHYAIWRQIAGEINKTYSPEECEIIANGIPEELRNDREAIIQTYYQYQVYFPEISQGINDSYLKIQGIETGVEDYDRFLQLYLSYKESIKNNRERL